MPVDFVTTHHYPTDALGHEDDDTETQLANSQRGILREWTQDTRRRAGTLPVYYTEWNSSSNPRDPRHDEPYAAAFVAKTALEASDLVQGYSFWTFSDIFEENYFPSVPFHGGFGLLNLHGIAKPTYRAFELLHRLGTERLLVDGLHETVNAWVTRDNARVTVLLVNHALPRHSIASVRVRVHLAHAPEPSGAWVERIDEHHANAKRRWQALGAPEYLDGAALEQLHEASRLTRQACPWKWREERIALEIELPPHAVAALTVELVASMSAQKSAARRRRRAYGDDQLQTLQRNTFRYFWEETNPENGLIPDNTVSRRHPCQHRRCGIRACQLSRRGRALVRVPRTGGRADAGHVALLLERSARSDAGRDRSSRLLLPFPRCHDRPARVAV